MKVGKSQVTRVTEVTLSAYDWHSAIIDYMKANGVLDTDQHVVIEINETRTEEKGTEMNVTLSNYNKDGNLLK